MEADALLGARQRAEMDTRKKVWFAIGVAIPLLGVAGPLLIPADPDAYPPSSRSAVFVGICYVWAVIMVAVGLVLTRRGSPTLWYVGIGLLASPMFQALMVHVRGNAMLPVFGLALLGALAWLVARPKELRSTGTS